MRKIKNKKTDKLKKMKNLLGDFYSSIARPEAHMEEFENLSKKEMSRKVACLKMAAEITNIQLRSEEKYQYYINLYYIYEMLSIYFQKENKFISKRNVEPSDNENIQDKFGYEPAFSKEIHEKVEDAMFWLNCCLNKLIHKYHVVVRNYTQLHKEIEFKINNSPRVLTKGITGLDKEMDYLNKILVRMEYARKKVNIIYSLEENLKEEDKKTRAMVKAALTRTQNLLNILIKDIEV